MRYGNEKSSSSSSMLDCDVGLGLKMQVHPTTESYSSSCKRATMAFPFYNNYQQQNANLTTFSGESGGPALNQVAGGGGDDIYEAGGDGAVLPMTFHNNSGFRPSAAGVYGKAPFTAKQWQELERQRIIHKYMMASIPVPPQLLLPAAGSATSLAPVSSGLEQRFPTSTGSDPEPWRCKRTDGKKWRCSRDVAPDQKYCERHAHKGKNRSRKLVEQPVSSHKSYTTTTKFQSPTSLFPTTMAASANDQTRSIERFIRGAAANNSTTVSQQQQWLQQVFQTPSSTTTTLDFTIDNNSEHRNKNVSSIYDQQTYEDPYIPDTNFNSNSFLDLKDDKTTRHFIDAWEKEYNDGISSSHSNHKKKKSSSLSLSMYNNGLDENGSNAFLEIGMMSNSNSVSWMNNSPPGGPLGEALCLGNASTRRCNSNTNSSSCEDGSQALNFIG